MAKVDALVWPRNFLMSQVQPNPNQSKPKKPPKTENKTMERSRVGQSGSKEHLELVKLNGARLYAKKEKNTYTYR